MTRKMIVLEINKKREGGEGEEASITLRRYYAEWNKTEGWKEEGKRN